MAKVELNNSWSLTMRTEAVGFLLCLFGHCSAAYSIPAGPNKTTQDTNLPPHLLASRQS